MPVYDYRCSACSSVYDIYHKTREVLADVVCPSCGSGEHTKLMSVPAAVGMSASHAAPAGDACANPGGCCGGSCEMN